MNFIQVGSTRINLNNIAAYAPFTLDVVGVRVKYGIKMIYHIDPECCRELMYISEEARNETLEKLDAIINVKKL
jgi:hypothetical protein